MNALASCGGRGRGGWCGNHYDAWTVPQAVFLKLLWPGTTAAMSAASNTTDLAAVSQDFLQVWTDLARGGSSVREGGVRPEFVGVVGNPTVAVPVPEAAADGEELRRLLPYMMEALDAEQKQLPGSLSASLWDIGACSRGRLASG